MSAKLLRRVMYSFCILIFVSCASGIKKVDIPQNAIPADEITKLESDIQEGLSNQADLFAKKDFQNAIERLDEAKKDVQKNKSQTQILDTIGYARAYLERALSETSKKMNPKSGIVKARQAAIDAGAKQNSQFTKDLNRIDKDLRSATSNFEKALPAHRLAKFQKAYLDLELVCIKSRHLGSAMAQIKSAEDEGASKRAPKSYRRALLDLREAENEIMADRHAPARFESAVVEASNSAKNLVEAMRIIRSSKAGLDEEVALRLIQQNRTISGLKSELQDSQSQIGQMNQSVSNQTEVIASQAGALSESQKQLRLQEAIKEAQSQFSDEEAEVYQKGDQLILRLKKVSFGKGKTNLPQDSEEILDKVKSVASDLSPKKIVVEGHTDSVGGAKINQQLSRQRAEVVANYLEKDPFFESKVEAIGYGYKRPIAPNKTREGRAQNRRVDIIITPDLNTSSNSEPTAIE